MPGENLLKTLDHVWKALAPLDIPMAVMGGLAVSIYQHARSTRDVDILIQIEEQDTDRILEALARQGIRPRRIPPLLNLDRQFILFLYFQPQGAFFEIKIDLLYADNDYQRQALARRVAGQLPGADAPMFFLSCEDLIIHKLQAGRIIDRADCAYLVRANRSELDFVYLEKWLGVLSLMERWNEIWSEAFPQERSPLTLNHADHTP
jgi:hypothetical protein